MCGCGSRNPPQPWMMTARWMSATASSSHAWPQAEEVARLVKVAEPNLGTTPGAVEFGPDRCSCWCCRWSSSLVPSRTFFPGFNLGLEARCCVTAPGLRETNPNITFADVAEDEAVAELREITEFLTNPERFHARRKYSARCPVVRPTRYRKDPSGPRCGR